MKKVILSAVALFAGFFLLAGLVVMLSGDEEDAGDPEGELVLQVSEDVLRYRDLVVFSCNENGISSYVDYILAIMQVESRGLGVDVLACGASSPEESIREGCRIFATHVQGMKEYGCDFDTVLQSYNYGGGYMQYVLNHGKKHTFALAEEFAKTHSGGVKVTYTNPIAVAKNGGWRYKYGNMFYVELVHQCFVESGGSGGGSGSVAVGVAGTVDPKARLTWLFPGGVPQSSAQMQNYLTQIAVPVVDASGRSGTITLTVHKKLANEIQAVFQEMKAAGFPVRASDTGGYVWRQMASGANRSHHSYGCVIDLNWTSNPMLGVTGGSYRPGVDPYSVTPKVVAIWKRHGFYWGGDWKKSKDYMHFTYTNH